MLYPYNKLYLCFAIKHHALFTYKRSQYSCYKICASFPVNLISVNSNGKSNRECVIDGFSRCF